MAVNDSPKKLAKLTNEEEEQESKVPNSFKDKVNHFVQKNAKILLILAGVLILLSIVALIYFIFFYESKMERFANQFCSCTETSQSDFYNYSKDGFGYKSDISTCFGMEFSAYGQDYNKATKRLLLEDFKEAVVEKCPNKLDSIFEY